MSAHGLSKDARTRLPLSDFQQSLWTMDQLNRGDPALHMAAVLYADRSLDPERLTSALDAVLHRQPMLRGRVAVADGTPAMEIEPDCRVIPTRSGSVSDVLAGVPESVPTELLERARAPFDLSQAPLVRCHIAEHRDGYAILLTVHHLVADGLSMRLLMDEVAQSYTGAGTPDGHCVAPVSAEAVAPEDVAWWAEQCRDASADLRMPADAPAAPGARSAAKTSAILPAEEAGALRAVARENGCSVFAMHLAAIGLLMGRLGAVTNPVVGVPFSGRTEANSEVIGCYVSTLPLTCDLRPDQTAQQYLAQTGETLWDALEHPAASHDAVAARIRAQGGTAPQIRALLNLVPFSSAGYRLGDTPVEVVEVDTLAAKFDVTLYVRDVPGEQGLLRTLDFVYDAGRWSAERAECFRDQYLYLLDQLVHCPDRVLADVALPAAEVPGGSADLPDPGQSLLEAVLATCARVPERVAIREAGTELTYGELAQAVRAEAGRLRAHGVEPGQLIAIHGDRGAGLVVEMLAAWFAGAGFVIIPVGNPAGRVRQFLDTVGPAAFVITDLGRVVAAEVERTCDEHGIPQLRLGHGSVQPAAASPEPESDVAYVQFTSGSRGRPAAVSVSSAVLHRFLLWYLESFELTEDDRFGWLSAPGHDPSLRDVFAPLLIGAVLDVPPEQESLVQGELAQWLLRSGVTVANLIPSLIDVLSAEFSGRSIPTLRRLFFGGQLLARDHVERARALAPNASVFNFYGATETPQVVLWQRVDETSPAADPPLGRPRPDVTVEVINSSGHPAGVGEPGELIIRTPLLAQGYVGDEAATARRFSVGQDEVPTYRTGDVVRVRPDGAVVFLGRRDRQLQLNGHRIEPLEVESVLTSHPGIAEAVVCRRDGPTGGRLVAVVSTTTGATVTAKELLSHARAELPGWMVPGMVHWVDSLPRLANGKIDYEKAHQSTASTVAQRDYVPPQTGTEVQLAAIWQEVLGGAPVSRDADFFAVGGHSVAAIVVVNRVREHFGVDLEVRALFRVPVLHDLAAEVDSAAPSSGVAIESRERAMVDLDELLAGLESDGSG